jgi:hypothetical protein
MKPPIARRSSSARWYTDATYFFDVALEHSPFESILTDRPSRFTLDTLPLDTTRSVTGCNWPQSIGSDDIVVFFEVVASAKQLDVFRGY